MDFVQSDFFSLNLQIDSTYFLNYSQNVHSTYVKFELPMQIFTHITCCV
jgi:hypothetical protein